MRKIISRKSGVAFVVLLLLVLSLIMPIPAFAQTSTDWDSTQSEEPVAEAEPTEQLTQGKQDDAEYRESEAEWQTLLQEKIIPITVFAISAIGSIYIAIAPVLNKMKNAAGNLDSAAGGMQESTRASRDAAKQVEAFQSETHSMTDLLTQSIESGQSQINRMVQTMERMLAENERQIREVERSMETVKDMLAIGFGNSDEMVQKGYARTILAMREEGAGTCVGGDSNESFE